MRFNNIQYLEKECVTVSIRNNNTSVALVDGQPCYFDNNNVASVNLGVDVKRFSEALGQSPVGLKVGIVKTNKVGGLVLGEVGEAVVYGFTDIVITRRTRAASTDSWASVASNGAGDALKGESIGNNMSWHGVMPLLLAIPSGSTGQTVTLPPPIFVVAGESLASLQSDVSTYSPTGAGSALIDGYRMKAFVRAM